MKMSLRVDQYQLVPISNVAIARFIDIIIKWQHCRCRMLFFFFSGFMRLENFASVKYTETIEKRGFFLNLTQPHFVRTCRLLWYSANQIGQWSFTAVFSNIVEKIALSKILHLIVFKSFVFPLLMRLNDELLV